MKLKEYVEVLKSGNDFSASIGLFYDSTLIGAMTTEGLIKIAKHPIIWTLLFK